MPESTSSYRKQALKDLSAVPREALEDVIKNLVEKEHLSAGLVNEEVEKVRTKRANDANEKAKTSGEITKVSSEISKTVAQTGSKSGSEKPDKGSSPESGPETKSKTEPGSGPKAGPTPVT